MFSNVTKCWPLSFLLPSKTTNRPTLNGLSQLVLPSNVLLLFIYVYSNTTTGYDMSCFCHTLQWVEDAEGVEGRSAQAAKWEEDQTPRYAKQSGDPQQGTDVLLGSLIVSLPRKLQKDIVQGHISIVNCQTNMTEILDNKSPFLSSALISQFIFLNLFNRVSLSDGHVFGLVRWYNTFQVLLWHSVYWLFQKK